MEKFTDVSNSYPYSRIFKLETSKKQFRAVQFEDSLALVDQI